MSAQILEGLLVVTLKQAVPASYCTSRLAGAEAWVIKVEWPEGELSQDYDQAADGQSAYFVWLIRGIEPIGRHIIQKRWSAATALND